MKLLKKAGRERFLTNTTNKTTPFCLNSFQGLLDAEPSLPWRDAEIVRSNSIDPELVSGQGSGPGSA